MQAKLEKFAVLYINVKTAYDIFIKKHLNCDGEVASHGIESNIDINFGLEDFQTTTQLELGLMVGQSQVNHMKSMPLSLATDPNTICLIIKLTSNTPN